ncbi:MULTISPECIES: rhodanese-like domain-containing protein [Exiguobacterium]|uniref:MBL fold metallo-hydrolase n=1 Tax=Exiguobacterium TaxID=33986 RepID=UPI000877A576|nr:MULTISPECIES: MBL fold metallo-hydrolase [Exiguobacterium]TCI24260.1 MBL fold metallo-hydrolase [Exiguobacterium sp. SH5S4]TCI37689.1 MBL fold metallo-hydrolase [Exiguobacterium sp. SH4S7]TCI53582.1 MBL fold metallo-hydrolase [Exiguobacterium sp. SH5S13]TCI65796.1 MBL fold metallo-hydrolase [Exiguobacterium sp. SH0S2]TCI72255.1 MBL fold metallo-hydrolase [Exiguobacterium sp. SH0S7]
MLLRYFYDQKLAQASYMVGCQMTGEAVVIDPARNITPYLQEAEKEGMTIVATAETHIHADFVSGSLELAKRTGSTAYLSDEGDASWKYAFAKDIDSKLVKDGDTFKVGNVTLEVMHTPGHTPEHISFLLYDRNQTQPMGIFTGDFVFVGDIGRPDLLEEAAGVKGTTAIGAEQMFHSLNKFKALPDFVQVWPGHGAGSACGKALGAIPTSTVGYEKATNWALQMTDKDAFIKELTTDQPEPPNYFAMMKKVNKEGIQVTNEIARPEVVGTDRLDTLVEATQVVDTRRGEDFAQGHVPGTINIPYNTKFVSWAGWLVNFDKDITLIASAEDVEEVQTDLQSIGLDRLRFIVPVEELGQELLTETYTDVTAEQAIESAEKNDVFVLDVRNATEWNASHYEKAERILLGKLMRDHDGLPTDKTIAVHCASGVRSRMAASVLQSLGYKDIQNILGGYAAMKTVLNAEQIG